ncbi:hypothetical protein ACSAZL_07265 [Methanosarcina sp. T3]|uniref:hypothetical protein n=1 Tax=Methanosarcina sp. T3 TaxID=3439062 RepID=UPI003F85EDA7
MKVDLRNIGVIAQKEFADQLYSPSFRMLLGIFTVVVLSMSFISGKEGCELFNQGFGFIDIWLTLTIMFSWILTFLSYSFEPVVSA